MALRLTRELETGATGNYWRICALNVSRDGKGDWHACASLLLHASEEARAAGKPHMHQETKEYAYDPQYAGCPIAQAYAGVKALPEFAGAVDC